MIRTQAMVLFCLVVVACSSHSELESQLAGRWQGLNEDDGFKWCFEFGDAESLTIRTLQRAQYDDGEDWPSRGRVAIYSGRWIVADGKRLMLYPDFENANRANRSENAEPLPELKIPIYYVVGAVSQVKLKMTDDPRGSAGSWIESSRVDACSTDFNLIETG